MAFGDVKNKDVIFMLAFSLCFSFIVVLRASAEEVAETKTEAETEMAANGVSNGANGSANVVDKFQDFNETWERFDVDKDGGLNLTEFTELCRNLFQNSSGEPRDLDEGFVGQIFKIFDLNQNGFLCQKEFRLCFDNWVSKIINPVSVFVIVDVQNDFISGSLALKDAPAGQDGKEVIPPINKLLDTVAFRQVFYTKDWHPADHISFIDNIPLRKIHESSKIKSAKDAKVLDVLVFEGKDGKPIEQKMWPRHCVMDSWGSELDPELKVKNGSEEVTKGSLSELDSYSAFLDNDKKSLTPLKSLVDFVGATDVYVCGLAYDVCVGATSVDSLSLGYRTVLVDDASKGVTLDGIEMTKEKIKKMNGLIVQSNEVNDMVKAKDRRPELGLYLAKRLQPQAES